MTGTSYARAIALIVLIAPSVGRATIATQLTAGPNHACALSDVGGVQCWGLNANGELGDGVFSRSDTPVDVVGLASGVASIAAGLLHTCVVTAAGGIKCWGANNGGQLGDGTAIDRSAPVDVTGLTSGGAAVAGGSMHSCAVTTTGAVKCWGFNLFGQLGNGTTTDGPAPVDVTGLASGIAALAAGQHHTCALTTGGGVKCWGYNATGQLGNGTTTSSSTPVDVTGLASGVAAIAAADSHTCALTTGGGVKCWGQNNFGDLGDGTTTGRSTPVDAVGLTSGIAGLETSSALCALTTAGRAMCWGEGETVASEMPYFSGMTALVRASLVLSGITTTGEIRSSRGGEFTEGYGPLQNDHWPFGCALGYGDSDGDAICDTLDPCNSLDGNQQFTKPAMTLRRINTETIPGNDGLTLKAQFELPSSLAFGDLDPLAQGARLVFLHPLGVTADLVMPAGAYTGPGTAGWTASTSGRPRWEFTDATGAPNGRRIVTRLTVLDYAAGAPGGKLQISLTAKAGNFPLGPDDLPLQVSLILGDASAGAAGACGEGRFQRSCAFTGNGSTLACKPSIRNTFIFF